MVETVKTDQNMLMLESRRIGVLLEFLGDRLTAARGLSATQTQMLLYILRYVKQGTSLTEIHREFGYSLAALSNILKRLRNHGYVRVESCLEDNRCKKIYATQEAVDLEPFLKDSVQKVYGQAYQGFSDWELAELDRLQKKVLGNLSAEKERHKATERSGAYEKSSATIEAV